MGEPSWFYRHEQEWVALVERIKLTSCPHCRVVGTLIQHGSLTGFDDSSPRRKTLRARRLFCSNRGRKPGCGRTVSVWLADKIRRLSVTTRTLHAFLRQAVVTGFAAAIRAATSPRSGRTWQRLWTRFDHAQSRLRTALLTRGPPPDGVPAPGRRPDVAHVLDHFSNAFPDAGCPLTAFQLATRSFVL